MERRLSSEGWVVEYPAPGAVRLTACDFGGGDTVAQARGCQREIAVQERRLLMAGLEVRPAGNQVRVGGSNLRVTRRDRSVRKSHHGVVLVQIRQSVDVAGVEPLDDQPAQVFGCSSVLWAYVVDHPTRSHAVATASMLDGFQGSPVMA